MARYPFEEYTRVVWAPTVASISAPTVANITAGTDLTCFITKDGLNPGGTSNKVDTGVLCNRVDGQVAGSVGYDYMLRLQRDNDVGGDDAWDLAVWGTNGYLIVRRGVLYGTAVAAAQKVEVFQAQMLEPLMVASAGNTNQAFELGLAVQAANQKATVAA